MKRVLKWRKSHKQSSKTDHENGLDKEDTAEVDDIQWDEAGIGTWHKDQNVGNPSSHVTLQTGEGISSPEHQCIKPNDEILTEWDGQFDFCLKDSPNNSPVKSKTKREVSSKSPKVRVKEVLFKGKDFVKSKVNSCKEKFSRNSMKENKKKESHSAGNGEEKGNNSSLCGKGDNSSLCEKGDNCNELEKGGNKKMETEPRNSVIVADNEDEVVTVSAQNGSSGHEDFMELPECFTTYKGAENNESAIHHAHNRSNHLTNGNDPHIELTNGNMVHKHGSADNPDAEDDDVFSEVKGQDNLQVVVTNTTDGEKVKDQGQGDKKRKDSTEEDQRVLDEAIPLGTEAQSFGNSSRGEPSQLEVPIDKRLQWLFGNLDQKSFGSDLSQNTATSNSSDISVDMLLQNRSDDPEQILKNLGFGDAHDVENPIERIPGRFILADQETAPPSVPQILSDNPDLSQLLQAFNQQEVASGTSETQSANMDAMMSGHGNPNYSNMFNSVMHGMKFLNFLSGAKSLSNLDKPDEHPSILQNPKNREYLAKQGFYERSMQAAKAGSDAQKNKLVKSQSLDASEKRKRFQATKSRNYSSLTNVPEQDEVVYSRRNFQSMGGASFETARTSGTSFDYGRSITSIETSTDSFDSGDSSSGRRRHVELIKQESESPIQSNIVDSGIWHTQDSTKSFEDDYLAESSRELASDRRSQVRRMMSADHYEVGDDNDILKSPPLSRTGSLETTLTQSGFQKLQSKSSTLIGHESFDDDIDIYSERYLDRQEVNEPVMNQMHSGNVNQSPNSKSCINDCHSSSPLPSGWNKIKGRKYGTEMSVRVPGNRIEAEYTNSNGELRRSFEKIPIDQVQTEKSTDRLDKPGIGSIGRIESVQSDTSSGFAEAELIPEPQIVQKVSSLGSSTESDKTFKSSITILPTKSSQKKSPTTSVSNTTQEISLDMSGSDISPAVSRIDIAVGTDDFSEYLHAPSVSYHIHEREGDDSGTETDKSVILTIELPKKWVNTNPNKKAGKPRVVSHLYKEIGHRNGSVDFDLRNNGAFGVHHRNQSNYPLLRTVSDGHVPLDFPQRSSTPFKTVHGHHLDIHPCSPRSTSPTSLSVFSDFGPSSVNYHSERSLNYSSSSLASKTDSVYNNSLEYYKLMKLINQPVSFKNSATGQKGIIRFEPKFNIKKWTQLQKQHQLEEETKLVQHTLQKYKAELNVMESQFLVKTQLVKDDLSYGDREDVQELQCLWAELRKEVSLMEQTLTNRLSGIKIGNDNYNPLLALDVIRKMTELLREQIYQQQMTIEKEEETMETTHSTTLWPSSTNHDSKMKSISMSDLESEQSFNSLSELKDTILSEVRQELHDNTQWLQRELQRKERELNALKMELIANNIKTGCTRKKSFFESDV